MRVPSGGWKILRRVSAHPYIFVVVSDHPKATKHGYVGEHVVVMENQLKQRIPEGSLVHHKNGNRKDNRPENLEVLTKSEHMIAHRSVIYSGKNTIWVFDGNFSKRIDKSELDTYLKNGWSQGRK